MLRISLLILSLFSLIYGIYFLFFPLNFALLTNAEITNIAWLRNIGASITGLLFIGFLLIFIEPKNTIKILRVITITSIIQTTALIYSKIAIEFSAKKLIFIDITIYAAIFVSIYLIFISIRYKNYFK